MFRSYEKVDGCLTRCEKRFKTEKQQQFSIEIFEKNTGDLRQAYAGLQFICKEKKEGKKLNLKNYNFFKIFSRLYRVFQSRLFFN